MIPRKSLLTTQQTTYHFGALGNSGLGSAEERGLPSGKGAEKAIFSGNCLHRSVWDVDAAGSNPVTPTKNPLKQPAKLTRRSGW